MTNHDYMAHAELYLGSDVKTAAAQCYTKHLAHTLQVTTATDSPAHFQLFSRALEREHERLPNHLIIRTGY